MRIVHIVGGKNQGKTTLLTALIPRLQSRGLKVGAVKHTCHEHDIDAPGSDSYRLRESGAAPAAFVTGEQALIALPLDSNDNFYERLAPLFADCNLILVEGHLSGPGLKIEIRRGELQSPCLALERDDIAALVTDAPFDELAIPTFALDEFDRIVDFILKTTGANANRTPTPAFS